MSDEPTLHPLKVLRLNAGYTIRGLAAAAGIDRKTLERWESGETQPSIDKLWLVANTLDVDPERLLARVNAWGTEEAHAPRKCAMCNEYK